MKKQSVWPALLLALGFGLPSYGADEAKGNLPDSKGCQKQIIQEILHLHDSIHVMVLAAGGAGGEEAGIAAGSFASEAIRNAIMDIVSYFDEPLNLSSISVFMAVSRAAAASACRVHSDRAEAVSRASFKAMLREQDKIGAYIEHVEIKKNIKHAVLKNSIGKLLNVDIEGLKMAVIEIRKYYIEKITDILNKYIKTCFKDEYLGVNNRLVDLIKAVLPPEMWASYQGL